MCGHAEGHLSDSALPALVQTPFARRLFQKTGKQVCRVEFLAATICPVNGGHCGLRRASPALCNIGFEAQGLHCSRAGTQDGGSVRHSHQCTS